MIKELESWWSNLERLQEEYKILESEYKERVRKEVERQNEIENLRKSNSNDLMDKGYNEAI